MTEQPTPSPLPETLSPAPASAETPPEPKELRSPSMEVSNVKRDARLYWLWGCLAAALVVAGWQILDLRQRVGAQQEAAARLAEDAAKSLELRKQNQGLQETVGQLQQKIVVLESRVSDFQGQQQSLEGLYQDLSRGRDEWLLAEVDQLVGMAVQQLQLSGNVSAALVALENADARLARSQRPQFIGLRKAIGHDLQRLKNAPNADIQGLSLRLENILVAVDLMPLAYETRPASATRGAAQKGADAKAQLQEPFWERWLRETWAELRSLIHVERIGKPDPAILAPNQIFFLRENLKLRLLSARVELLSRDQTAFRAEIKLAEQWLERHFDARDKQVAAAIDVLRPMLGSELSIALPSLAESQSAVRAVKLPSERSVR